MSFSLVTAIVNMKTLSVMNSRAYRSDRLDKVFEVARTRVASRNHPRELRERRRPSSDAFCRPPDTATQRRVTEVHSPTKMNGDERRKRVILSLRLAKR